MEPERVPACGERGVPKEDNESTSHAVQSARGRSGRRGATRCPTHSRRHDFPSNGSGKYLAWRSPGARTALRETMPVHARAVFAGTAAPKSDLQEAGYRALLFCQVRLHHFHARQRRKTEPSATCGNWLTGEWGLAACSSQGVIHRRAVNSPHRPSQCAMSQAFRNGKHLSSHAECQCGIIGRTVISYKARAACKHIGDKIAERLAPSLLPFPLPWDCCESESTSSAGACS